MPTSPSPLRYPGGKTKLYSRVVNILKKNGLNNITYVEPFCGGCGLAIKLLLNNDVSRIIINDIDPLIHSFWDSVLNNSEGLCSRLDECTISIEERDTQIGIIQNRNDHSVLDVGFATLFLNRTNISGILTAGPVGGRNQVGVDKLDARFKKDVLKEKISTIASQKGKISLYNLDVIDFMENVLPENNTNSMFINFDPPYVNKGQELYINHFVIADHNRLYDKISQCNHHWIVTYDYHEIILDLYGAFSFEPIQLNHSAGKMKKGKELIIYSNNIQVH